MVLTRAWHFCHYKNDFCHYVPIFFKKRIVPLAFIRFLAFEDFNRNIICGIMPFSSRGKKPIIFNQDFPARRRKDGEGENTEV